MRYNKNAILTGANRGIGAVILEELAGRGCNIWACARKYKPDFEDRVKALSEKYDVWIKPIYFDLSNEKEIVQGIKNIIKEKLPVDILVNNAGVAFGGLMTMTPISKLREVFDVNFFSQILVMQLISRYMIRQL